MFDTALLQREWTAFRRPGRITALAAATLTVIAFGLLFAFGSRSDCGGPCPAVPTAADGSIVSDTFWFVHRDLGPEGSITARLTSMTGTITYPPPDHDEIVPGLVPWAKTGIIVKDGIEQGSAYAAVMMTGDHGVRMQYDYEHDIAGSRGEASPESPRWLRLTRSADTITGYESSDGEQWRAIGTATLTGLPNTVQVGLFAASPGDLTLREVGLGGVIEESRFTQATGVFDSIALEGAADGAWLSEPIGRMNRTDWEKHHNASGAVEQDGVITVSGTGDIGPHSEEGGRTVRNLLAGLAAGLIVVLVVAARFGARTAVPAPGPSLVCRAVVVGAASFVTGLVAIGVVLPIGIAVLERNGVPVPPVPLLTGSRVVIGLAVVLALCSAFAYWLGTLLRRGWAAIAVVLSLVALPYAVTAFPLLPDAVSQWLLRLTPAAAFAVQQTTVEYPQVVAHYAPSAGYFPLPAWAGIAVLCGYTLAAAWWALSRHRNDRRIEPVAS
ncbi:hypothetical protein [Glycomyces arizonensis]|uniref:hypothetical protein n=1 Tax=Glycomyces arizonensis TaxID=256035 RepID=UPI00047E8C15|nr:hypothetical protein [Glycomyces arizonensis]